MKIIYALDYNCPTKALNAIDDLYKHVHVFKIGSELAYTHGLSTIIDSCNHHDIPVMLDIKLSDIDETMVRTIAALTKMYPLLGGITLRTLVNTEGFEARLERHSIDISMLKEMGLIAVPTLTSDPICQRYSVTDSIANKVRIIKNYCCTSIVCSGVECEFYKIENPRLITIIPGIRPDWANVKYDDQKKTITPANALKVGADYIVVGRVVRDHSSPIDAMKMIKEEITNTII